MLLWDHFQFQRKPNFVHKALKIFPGFCRNTLKCSFLKHLLSSPHTAGKSCPGEPPDSCCDMEILCSLLTFFQARRRPVKPSVATSTGRCISALRKGAGVGPGSEKGQQLCRLGWSPPWAEGQSTSSRNATMLVPRKPGAPARQWCFMHKVSHNPIYHWLYLQTPQLGANKPRTLAAWDSVSSSMLWEPTAGPLPPTLLQLHALLPAE